MANASYLSRFRLFDLKKSSARLVGIPSLLAVAMISCVYNIESAIEWLLKRPVGLVVDGVRVTALRSI